MLSQESLRQEYKSYSVAEAETEWQGVGELSRLQIEDLHTATARDIGYPPFTQPICHKRQQEEGATTDSGTTEDRDR